MSDERLSARLHATERPVSPDPAFLDRMYVVLADELGFESATPVARHPDRSPSMRGRFRLLLLAAALAALTAGAALLAGSLLQSMPRPRTDDLLDRVRSAGRVKVGVVSTYPQAVAPTRTTGGFDIDVATELGQRLGIGVELEVLPPADLLTTNPVAWDFALSASALTRDQSTAFDAAGVAYYWPIQVLVQAGSTATDLASLSGRRIRVPTGTVAELWLSGRYDGASATPVQPPPAGAIAVPAASDADCLAHIASGAVDALVTATLGPADLVVRPALRSLVGPALVQPRGPVVRRSSDSNALASEISTALSAMRADDTLRDISRRRFGADLTSPPPP